MLRIAEEFHKTHVGMQRTGNEDSLFVQVPLFVVADGMGGAQAGEVASQEAVKAFQGGLGDGDPAASLEAIIRGANRQIHDLSQGDPKLAGMGTTTTAAYLADDNHVYIAHVGDSRAYLWRAGGLTRLTRDHSLVGELIARGRLTEEQAETHPQRSVITRALGPDPEVKVDTEAYEVKAGDVFLVCSDGLTTMVSEANLEALFEIEMSLSELGEGLIDAANHAGGRDNITVILFRVEDTDDDAVAVADADDATLVADSALRTEEVAAAVAEAEAAEPPRRTAPPPPSEGPPSGVFATPSARKAPRRRRRLLRPGGLFAVVAVAAVLAGGWIATRGVYFVGTDSSDQRTITIFRGLPYELPFGIRLYERYAGSGLTLDSIPPRRRETFTNHKLRSRDDAEDLVIAAERGKLEG